MKRTAGVEIERLIQLLAKLPGLGPRSARRAALYLIKNREKLLSPLSLAMADAQDKVTVCSTCGNVDTIDPCTICSDPRRDRTILCVVEEVGDLWALERAGAWTGLYHVLGGTLSAMEGIRPEDLAINHLIERAAAVGHARSGAGHQCHGGGPDHRPLHHRAPEGVGSQHLAPGPWRAGRRRTRLSRRRHAHRRHAGETAVLIKSL